MTSQGTIDAPRCTATTDNGHGIVFRCVMSAGHGCEGHYMRRIDG